MTQSPSVWVKDCLSARSRDITPAAVCDATQVLYAPINNNPEFTRACALLLSESELRRSERFARAADRSLFLQRRAFRRFCGAQLLGNSQSLSRVNFVETENGRPYLRELPNHWFSFSSWPYGYLGAWSTSHAIGVDIEHRVPDPGATDLARKYFSPAEASLVQGQDGEAKTQAFFELWTLKEAALKSIGEGLPYGLHAFEFELDPAPRIVRIPPGHGVPEQFCVHLVSGAENCTAIVLRSV